jgi:oligopeptide transport system substrate-binding protein
LADARVRRALNLVYDREAVANKVLKRGETPAYAYVPPGIAVTTAVRSWISSRCLIRRAWRRRKD